MDCRRPWFWHRSEAAWLYQRAPSRRPPRLIGAPPTASSQQPHKVDYGKQQVTDAPHGGRDLPQGCWPGCITFVVYYVFHFPAVAFARYVPTGGEAARKPPLPT